MPTKLQIFKALDAATEAALRASIEKHGVLVPVAVDQDGRIIDGHNRARIADELGVQYPTIEHHVRDDEHAQELARTINEDRRQLPIEQRREVVKDLRDAGHSTRAIAGALGVSKGSIQNDLAAVPTSTPAAPDDPPARVTGTDGKSYPREKARKRPVNPEDDSDAPLDELAAVTYAIIAALAAGATKAWVKDAVKRGFANEGHVE